MSMLLIYWRSSANLFKYNIIQSIIESAKFETGSNKPNEENPLTRGNSLSDNNASNIYDHNSFEICNKNSHQLYYNNSIQPYIQFMIITNNTNVLQLITMQLLREKAEIQFIVNNKSVSGSF